MKDHEHLRLFHARNALANAELDAIERQYAIDLGRAVSSSSGRDETYYPQFSGAVRKEAAEMAEHYEIFYCLENSIRELVGERMRAAAGETWWESAVPQVVKDNVAKNIEREREAGITLRSTDPLDYTTFGELGEVIKHNWDVFGDTFNSKKALEKVLSGLNLLRAPIAHCCPLAPDEVLRLRLALADWFRLME